MKIQLTTPELLAILTKHFKTTVEEIVIANVPTMADIIHKAISALDYNYSQKIQAIKTLRQVGLDNKWNDGITIGLANAKWAVENYTRFITYVRTNGNLPKGENWSAIVP